MYYSRISRKKSFSLTMGWSSMEDRCDLSVLIFMEYFEWLDALKMLSPTMSCSMKCFKVFSSLVSKDCEATEPCLEAGTTVDMF